MKPVSKTAYYCCGVRMMDAESRKPIVNDTYARNLMGTEGLQYWEAFRDRINPNGSNVARCYLIDSWIKELLLQDPNTTVILIGAGLDSRAFRIDGGNWIELDEPDIIEYKNEKLPVAQCTNKLQRIAINFERDKLADKLAAFTDQKPVIFVVEGVMMYLTNDQKRGLLVTLTSMFKNHILLCDLMNDLFFQRLGKRGIYEELKKSGAIFKDLLKNPPQMMMDFGYRLTTMKSNLITASDLGLLSIPRFVIKFLLKKVALGYSSYRFVYGS